MVSNRPNRPIKRSAQIAEGPEKPYALVPFPRQRPSLKAPIGHHRYANNGYHGTLHLTLKVLTALHVSTGVTALGSDVGSRVPLIKTMVQGKDQQLLIQGSSLKGCIRSIYEAITNSTLAVISSRYRQKMPKERLPCRSKESLCPASQVFGALDWQGLVHFTDATCESAKSVTGFMPSLYRPRPEERDAYFNRGRAAGRKFYRHAVKAVDGGARGIPVQQAGTEFTFKTAIHFRNLTEAQLGTLLIALGQDSKYPMALKLGGGKPVGMGTVQISIPELEVTQNVRERYTSYTPPTAETLSREAVTQFIQEKTQAAKTSKLVELPQLEALARILQWPTVWTAPEGMY
ncbi:RAMP superfamily CRISPR-associated protein [Oscillatoria sp. CS-180]|uniref:RAMP superfamily CRISPR-associated protein n=1 Tax=Oscillatoria sp. CS-180 TaxID=3021720 RepID=UPI00232E4EE8|nr:RAMP superfamily CRISPR-associated protein [Oscillatoria sp. CS-180]MDB9526782.1 RAMP superfamily CRISPR-associated protein [Oscillatoria sp. CS-180]